MSRGQGGEGKGATQVGDILVKLEMMSVRPPGESWRKSNLHNFESE